MLAKNLLKERTYFRPSFDAHKRPCGNFHHFDRYGMYIDLNRLLRKKTILLKNELAPPDEIDLKRCELFANITAEYVTQMI